MTVEEMYLHIKARAKKKKKKKDQNILFSDFISYNNTVWTKISCFEVSKIVLVIKIDQIQSRVIAFLI